MVERLVSTSPTLDERAETLEEMVGTVKAFEKIVKTLLSTSVTLAEIEAASDDMLEMVVSTPPTVEEMVETLDEMVETLEEMVETVNVMVEMVETSEEILESCIGQK